MFDIIMFVIIIALVLFLFAQYDKYRDAKTVINELEKSINKSRKEKTELIRDKHILEDEVEHLEDGIKTIKSFAEVLQEELDREKARNKTVKNKKSPSRQEPIIIDNNNNSNMFFQQMFQADLYEPDISTKEPVKPSYSSSDSSQSSDNSSSYDSYDSSSSSSSYDSGSNYDSGGSW